VVVAVPATAARGERALHALHVAADVLAPGHGHLITGHRGDGGRIDEGLRLGVDGGTHARGLPLLAATARGRGESERKSDQPRRPGTLDRWVLPNLHADSFRTALAVGYARKPMAGSALWTSAGRPRDLTV